MKKTIYLIIPLLFIVGVWFLLETGGWLTYDYGLHCTRCLLDRHVIEKRLFGYTVSRRETVRTPAQDYERLFGHPCKHVFRTGGTGSSRGLFLDRGIMCGITAEGAIFSYRLGAMQSVYDVERNFVDNELALRTFKLIDGLLPADATLDDIENLTPDFAGVLSLLARKLYKVSSTEEWRGVLKDAEGGFTSELGDAARQASHRIK